MRRIHLEQLFPPFLQKLLFSGVTKISPHEVEPTEVFHQILGVDSNSLYLACISEKCPTGFFCVYSKENKFSPDLVSSMGYHQWRCYISDQKNLFIQHKFNMSEQRVLNNAIIVRG